MSTEGPIPTTSTDHLFERADVPPQKSQGIGVEAVEAHKEHHAESQYLSGEQVCQTQQEEEPDHEDSKDLKSKEVHEFQEDEQEEEYREEGNEEQDRQVEQAEHGEGELEDKIEEEYEEQGQQEEQEEQEEQGQQEEQGKYEEDQEDYRDREYGEEDTEDTKDHGYHRLLEEKEVSGEESEESKIPVHSARLKILVTGGAGFIGSHVVDTYVDAGHEVVVIDDLSSGSTENLNPQTRFVEMDICDGDSTFLDFMAEEKFDVVNHHAGDTAPYGNGQKEDPVFNADGNITGTVAVLDAAVKSGVKKFIFSSSWRVYGDRAGPISEDILPYFCCPEGISKDAAENYIQLYSRSHGLDFTILRYSSVYGPRGYGIVHNLVSSILRGEEYEDSTVSVRNKISKDYVFVGDVARANLLALESASGQAINIGTGVSTSGHSLWQQICNVVKETGDRALPSYAKFPLEIEPTGSISRPSPRRTIKNCLDITKAEEELFWIPLVGLREGLHETVKYEVKRLRSFEEEKKRTSQASQLPQEPPLKNQDRENEEEEEDKENKEDNEEDGDGEEGQEENQETDQEDQEDQENEDKGEEQSKESDVKDSFPTTLTRKCQVNATFVMVFLALLLATAKWFQ